MWLVVGFLVYYIVIFFDVNFDEVNSEYVNGSFWIFVLFGGYLDWVIDVVFNEDVSWLVFVVCDKIVCVWDVIVVENFWEVWFYVECCWSVVYFDDGKWLVFVLDDFKVWNMEVIFFFGKSCYNDLGVVCIFNEIFYWFEVNIIINKDLYNK